MSERISREELVKIYNVEMCQQTVTNLLYDDTVTEL